MWVYTLGEKHEGNSMSDEISRGGLLGRALWLVCWLRERRSPFTVELLASEMETNKRTAYRWLDVALGHGLVELDREGSGTTPSLWKARRF